jgi:quercetin dioxygenase-like cupin family protein
LWSGSRLEKHWHGATDTTAISHVAIVEAQDGTSVNWLEHVSDEDYLA